MLRDDVPERTEEVTENQDEEDKAEDTENVHDVDLVHDLVVVVSHGLELVVLLNSIVNTATIQSFKQALELLRVQKKENFVETEESQKIEQVKLVLGPRIFKDLVEEDARYGYHIDKEITLQVLFGDHFQIANCFLFLIVLVLHEEVADDIDAKADFHHDIDHFS